MLRKRLSGVARSYGILKDAPQGEAIMTPLTFDEWACRNTRDKLDSYIDDELLVETNPEISRHFQSCRACAHEAAWRRELRGRLRAAARAVPAPTGLEERVRPRLPGKAGRKRHGRSW
jgi:anti-sigma factor RsiW